MLDRYEPAINDDEMLTCFLKMRNWRQEEQLLLEIFISRNECPDISFFFFQQLPLGITRLRLTLSLTSSSVTPTQACPPSLLFSSCLAAPSSAAVPPLHFGSKLMTMSCLSDALFSNLVHHHRSWWKSSALLPPNIFPSLLNNKHKLWLTRLLVWATGWR